MVSCIADSYSQTRMASSSPSAAINEVLFEAFLSNQDLFWFSYIFGYESMSVIDFSFDLLGTCDIMKKPWSKHSHCSVHLGHFEHSLGGGFWFQNDTLFVLCWQLRSSENCICLQFLQGHFACQEFCPQDVGSGKVAIIAFIVSLLTTVDGFLKRFILFL